MRRVSGMALAASLLLVTAAQADDTFMYDGFRYTGTVVGLRDGRFSAVVGATEKLYEVEKVSAITLGSNTKFGEAEAARTTDAKKAAALYKEAIRVLNDPALKRLAELRAIEPTDVDGKWTDAINYFLDIYAAAPSEMIWKARPTHMPAAGSSMLKESAERITTYLKFFKADDAKKNLKTLQLDIYTRAGETDAAQRIAKELATGIAEDPVAPKPREIEPAAAANAALLEIDTAIRSKNYDAAQKQADAMLQTSSGDLAIQLFQLKARAYEGQHQPALAVATLLRIPAHYPSSAAVPAALLQAAAIEKRAGTPEGNAAAKALYQEILTNYPDSKEAVAAKSQQ